MPNRTRARFQLLCLLASLLAATAFLPGLPGEFIFDDIPNITANPAVQLQQLDLRSAHKLIMGIQLSGMTRSLPMLSFAVDYWRAGGPDPLTFKLTNIAIHALTTLLLAWFFRLVLETAGHMGTRARWLALALALAWALHPLQVSSVLYVVQRIQTMGTLFLVPALIAYLQARRAQIAGRPGRTPFLLAVLFWLLALACKEDSAQVPAYTLALELTVLRFAAADARTATLLRRGYLLAVLASAAVFLLWLVPNYWHVTAYPGRDFSTSERLLTQARVLCLYLWQILVPLPSHMPFYYDWLEPSRGLLRPWTTLPALATIISLSVFALWQRERLPLFSLGVLLFLGAHFLTSNVVPLELAFEHRNHFALAGAVLAAGSALAGLARWLRLPLSFQAAACAALLAGLGTATLLRAHTWSTTRSIAQVTVEHTHGSGRAWTQLCAAHFSAGGGVVPGNPMLDRAVETCEAGVADAPKSLNSHTLLLVLKTLRGDITPQDWESFRQRIDTVPMTLDNARIHLILTFHARKGVALDANELVATLNKLAETGGLGPFGYAQIGYFVMNDLKRPDDAIPFFLRAIARLDPNDTFPTQLSEDLRAMGKHDLAETVEQAGARKRTR